MKMEQNATQTSTALLRYASGVDATETNNLCCIAAGNIAPLSAITEARTPHEKLREATTPDATLVAQNRSLAQLAQGYKSLSIDASATTGCTDPMASFINPLSSGFHVIYDSHGNLSGLRLLNDLDVMQQITDRCTKRKPFDSCFSSRHFFELHLTHEVVTASHRDLKLRQLEPVTTVVAQVFAGIVRGICNCVRNNIQLLQKLSLCLFRCSKRSLILLVGNRNRDDDCKNRTDCLYPSCRILFCIKSIEQDKQSPAQDTNSHKQPHNPHRRHAQRRWKLHSPHKSWSLAVGRIARLPTWRTSVHDHGNDGRKFSNKTQALVVGSTVSPWPMMNLIWSNNNQHGNELLGGAA